MSRRHQCIQETSDAQEIPCVQESCAARRYYESRRHHVSKRHHLHSQRAHSPAAQGQKVSPLLKVTDLKGLPNARPERKRCYQSRNPACE